MNPSTIRGIVGMIGLAAATIGIGAWSLPLALIVPGVTVFCLCVAGELRGGVELPPPPAQGEVIERI